ncbi:MAG: glycoside hydrolase 5 family protein [Nitrososphaerales archaeon]
MFEHFSFGINIDNVWTYSGLPPPKSMIIPFVVSLKLSRGPVDVFEHPNLKQAIEEQLRLPDESEAPPIVKELCDDLAFRLKEAGIGFVRTWFPWNFFKKSIRTGEEESFQFVMDTFVETLKSNGIEILGVLANGYSRFLPQGANVDHLGEYLKQLVPASREIVRHYKGSISTWQIENEPNWWKGHVAAHWRSGLIWFEKEAQEKVLSSLHDVVRQESPGAKIVINVEADRHPINWGLYEKYCDVLGLDFYPAYAHPHKTTAEEIKLVSSSVKKQTGKQLIVAETGQPSGPHFLGYSEERQSEYVKSACENAFSSDSLDGLCLWRFSDSYWRSFPMQENHFGLLTKKREQKLAWIEYANQIKAKS